MDDSITKKASISLPTIDDLPKISNFINRIGMPVVVLAIVCYLFFFQSNQSNEERKAAQMQEDETKTEMIDFLKNQHTDFIKVMKDNNTELREMKEVMKDIKNELKK